MFKYGNSFLVVNLSTNSPDKNKVITVFDLKGYSSKVSFFSKLYAEYKIRIKYECR